jgi:hypothetical protein
LVNATVWLIFAALAALARIDFFPGAAAAQAKDEADALRAAVDARFSPGEPRMRAGRAKRAEPGSYPKNRSWRPLANAGKQAMTRVCELFWATAEQLPFG